MPFVCLDGIYGTEIEMPDDMIGDLTVAGDCEGAARYWVDRPEIAAQLDAIGHEALVRALRECGAWTEEELADEEWTRLRAIWVAAGSVIEEESDPL